MLAICLSSIAMISTCFLLLVLCNFSTGCLPVKQLEQLLPALNNQSTPASNSTNATLTDDNKTTPKAAEKLEAKVVEQRPAEAEPKSAKDGKAQPAATPVVASRKKREPFQSLKRINMGTKLANHE